MGQINNIIGKTFSAFVDAMINFGAICIALLLINEVNPLRLGGTVTAISVGIAIGSIVVYFVFDMYTRNIFVKLHTNLIKLFFANLSIMLISMTVLATFSLFEMYVVVILVATAFSFVALLVKLLITTKAIHLIRAKRKKTKNIIIIGNGKSANELSHQIEENAHYGFCILGCVTDDEEPNINKLGSYDEINAIIEKYNPHEVVIAVDFKDEGKIQYLLDICDKCGVRAAIIPPSYQYFKSKCQVDMMGTLPIINTRAIPLDNVLNACAKRVLDIIVSLVLIAITLPIMLFAIIGIKISSKGPIIFKQKRIGKNNQEFTLYKFRSMRVNEMSDTSWTTDTDPRKTRFGTLMRKTGIDELPQLFNVLFGTMSIVGPRPELPVFVEEYSKKVPLYKVKHQVKPGITGLAQIYGYRGDTSIERRIELDIKYIEEWTIFSDIKIICITPFKMFNRNEKYVK